MNHNEVDIVLRKLASVGIATRGTADARAALDEPLPAALELIDYGAAISELARDVAGGVADSVAVAQRIAVIRASRSQEMAQLRDLVWQERGMAATRLLDGDADKIAKALDRAIGDARKASHTADEPLAAQRILTIDHARGAGSDALRLWEQASAARGWLKALTDVRAACERARLIEPAVDHAERRSALQKLRHAVVGDVYVG